MSVLTELRRARQSRIAVGRGPCWWLHDFGKVHGHGWVSRRAEDLSAWLVHILGCGISGHRWGVVDGFPEFGWMPAISCGRCGERP